MRRFCVAAILVIASAAHGQMKSSIVGVVTDESGSALPGVTITVVANNCCECTCRDGDNDYYCCDDASKLCCSERTAVTGADGSFQVPQLRVGSYSVKAVLGGFSTVQRSVTVSVGQTARVEIKMKPGPRETTISGMVDVIGTAEDGPVLLIVAPVGCCNCTCKEGRDYTCCANPLALCCAGASSEFMSAENGRFSFKFDRSKLPANQSLALYYSKIDPKTKVRDLSLAEATELLGTVRVPAEAVERQRMKKK